MAGSRALGDDNARDGYLDESVYGATSILYKLRISLTRLGRKVTVLLDTRGDLADELGLLAVASEVGQGRTSITCESGNEAVELVKQGSVQIPKLVKVCVAHRAVWDIRKLGAGQAGRNEGNKSVRELHFVQ